MPFDVVKFTEQKKTFKLTAVWKFIIGYVILQFLFVSFFSGIIIAILEVAISWIPILFLPCLLKYCFKIKFSKKSAILYTVIFGILLLFGNIVIDILIKEQNPAASTTTVWNLLMMITPYYLLTDKPMFSLLEDKTNVDSR